AHRSLTSFPTRRSSDLTSMTTFAFRPWLCRICWASVSITPVTDGTDTLAGVGDAAAVGLGLGDGLGAAEVAAGLALADGDGDGRSEEHTSELQSRSDLV